MVVVDVVADIAYLYLIIAIPEPPLPPIGGLLVPP